MGEIVLLIAASVLVVLFTGYSVLANRMRRRQEKELRSINQRLRGYKNER